MNILRKIISKMVTVIVLVAFTSLPVTARSLTAPDINLAFGDKMPITSRNMSAAEMNDTEGGWAAKVVVEIAKAVGKKLAKDAATSKGHTKGARPSTKGKHEKGDARRGKDKGKEKGDSRRRY